MVAEAPNPIPQLTIIVSCGVAAVLTYFLRKPNGEHSKPNLGKAEQAIELAQ